MQMRVVPVKSEQHEKYWDKTQNPHSCFIVLKLWLTMSKNIPMYQDISVLISRTFIIIWCSLDHYAHLIY